MRGVCVCVCVCDDRCDVDSRQEGTRPVRRHLLVELPFEAAEDSDKVGLLKRSLYGTMNASFN